MIHLSYRWLVHTGKGPTGWQFRQVWRDVPSWREAWDIAYAKLKVKQVATEIKKQWEAV